jgi:glycosyltransferase involved in cell wall biosynthesis
MYQDHVKLVLRVNENDARKNTSHMDEMLLKLAPHMDGIVFVSRWLQDYFQERGWPSVKSTVVINGVDRDVFLPQPKLNNGKVNIVAHHWSDNYLKGFDIYDQLDEFVGQNPDKFSFTYIGRDRNTFKHTKVIRPMVGKRLGQELGKYDLYISASRFDPGPNHVLEALSCELPTLVHKDGGGACEFAGHASQYNDWDQLKDILVSGELPAQNSVALSSWKTCVREYIDFLEAVCQPTKTESDSTNS